VIGVGLTAISVSLPTLLSFPNGSKINCVPLFTVNKHSDSESWIPDFTHPLLFLQQVCLHFRQQKVWLKWFIKLKVLIYCQAKYPSVRHPSLESPLMFVRGREAQSPSIVCNTFQFECEINKSVTQESIPNMKQYFSKVYTKRGAYSSMFVPCILDVVEMTNNIHWLYHSFTLYSGYYMFRQ
jgi:hypothetical protein